MFTKTVTLDLKDVESIERVLGALNQASPRSAERRSASPSRLLQFARLVFAVRRDRGDFLHPAMLGEPAFDMLLALYTAPGGPAGLTLVILSELSGVPQSSGLRWIEYLCSKKLIVREPHPTDKRASVVALTDQGRETLEALFTTMFDRFMEFVDAA